MGFTYWLIECIDGVWLFVGEFRNETQAHERIAQNPVGNFKLMTGHKVSCFGVSTNAG